MKVKGSVRSYRSKTEMVQDFPGGPVAKTLPSQCRGLGFDPWSRNQIPHATTKYSNANSKQLRPRTAK